MARITESSIQRVLDRADIVEVLSSYLRLELRGGRHWACCPFHTEKSPSFTVDRQKGVYYCFGCQKGGNLVGFLMELERLSYPEAIESLAKRYGIELEYEEGGPAKAERDARKDLLELYRRVAGSFHYILAEKPEAEIARAYLSGRGVDGATVDAFGLGYAPADAQWLYSFLRSKGYEAAFLDSSGLFASKGKGFPLFRDRVVFPIENARGECIAFGARLLRGEGPKYINSPDTAVFQKKQNLFAFSRALDSMRKAGEAIICEGYMDVIAFHRAGLSQAVAPLGTAFTPEQAKLLKRYVDRVALCFDSDEAGRKAALKAIELCEASGLECSLIALEGAKDPAEILEKSGGEALKKSAETRINEFTYLVNTAQKLHDASTPDGRSGAAKFLFRFLEAIEAEVRRDSAIEYFAAGLGIDKFALARDFSQRNDGQRISRRREEESRGGQEGLRAADAIQRNSDLEFMVAVAINCRDVLSKVRMELRLGDPRFDLSIEKNAKKIYIACEEAYDAAFRAGEKPEFADIIERLQDDELKSYVRKKQASDEYALNAEKTIADGLNRIKARMLSREKRELLIRINRFDISDAVSGETKEDLLERSRQIDAELTRLKGSNR